MEFGVGFRPWGLGFRSKGLGFEGLGSGKKKKSISKITPMKENQIKTFRVALYDVQLLHSCRDCAA